MNRTKGALEIKWTDGEELFSFTVLKLLTMPINRILRLWPSRTFTSVACDKPRQEKELKQSNGQQNLSIGVIQHLHVKTPP